MPIPRLQLFEFHDLAVFPPVFRQALTEWLRALWEYSKAEDVVAPILCDALRQSGAASIVDLCSGGTGPMIPVQRKLAVLGASVPVLATDKFPDQRAMCELEQKTGGAIKGSLESIDATELQADLPGLRTLWNSFHHFAPKQAREILRNAYASGQPIAIFEFTERTLAKTLLSFPASFFSVYLLIFRMRPLRASWWLCTWILPAIPFTIAWDGLVSHLRSYTPQELIRLTEGFDGYRWTTGRVRTPRAGLDVSFLIGRPFDNVRSS
jgi:hypothetical protein